MVEPGALQQTGVSDNEVDESYSSPSPITPNRQPSSPII